MRVRNATAEVAPTGSGTTVLLDSNIALQGSILDANDIVRYIVTVTNDQAGTIKLYKAETAALCASTTDLVAQQAVPVPTAPLTVSGPIDFAIDGLAFFRADWVNGGVTQTTWRLAQDLVEKQRVKQS
jgi:hypothetical protein